MEVARRRPFPVRAGGQCGSWLSLRQFLACSPMDAGSEALTSRRGAILSWLRDREDEMADLLARLVFIPTENPPGKNYRACVDLLEAQLWSIGLPVQRVGPRASSADVQQSPESMLVAFGAGKRVLYFHGHYDVVPAQHQDQFQALRRGHFLFGRGSADMKGGIVAMIYAIFALQQIEADLGGRIALILVPDEETGGTDGAAWLAGQGLLGGDGVGMLLPEPTSGVVWNASRGAISLRVRVFGKPAHVGLQYRGENAFERMHAVVERLRQLKHKVEARRTQFNTGSEDSRNSILMLGGMSGGGTNFNVVPAECWFTVDRRLNPEEDVATEKAGLLDVLHQCKKDGIPLEWEIFQEGSPMSCDDGPLGNALSNIIQDVTGNAPRFEMSPGLLETRYYAQQGIPALAYGPGMLSVAHGPNECVDLRRIVETAAIYALTAIEILTVKSWAQHPTPARMR